MERGWVCDCVPVLTYQLAQPQGFCFRRSLGRPRVSFSTSFQVPESAGLGTALGELLVQGTVISHLGYCPSLLAGLEMATSTTWSLSSHPILLPIQLSLLLAPTRSQEKQVLGPVYSPGTVLSGPGKDSGLLWASIWLVTIFHLSCPVTPSQSHCFIKSSFFKNTPTLTLPY